MKRLALIAAITLSLTACGTSTVRDERRNIGGVDCVVVASNGGDSVGVSCDWARSE